MLSSRRDGRFRISISSILFLDKFIFKTFGMFFRFLRDFRRLLNKISFFKNLSSLKNSIETIKFLDMLIVSKFWRFFKIGSIQVILLSERFMCLIISSKEHFSKYSKWDFMIPIFFIMKFSWTVKTSGKFFLDSSIVE